jgi:hypothetical protein
MTPLLASLQEVWNLKLSEWLHRLFWVMYRQFSDTNAFNAIIQNHIYINIKSLDKTVTMADIED